MSKVDREYAEQVAGWVEDIAKQDPLIAIEFCDAMSTKLHKIRSRLLTDNVTAAKYVLPENT